MKKIKKILVFLMCFLLCLLNFNLIEGKNKVSAAPGGFKRLCGNNRYETAISIAQDGWSAGSDNLIIASGDNQSYADSICAGPLAYKYKAPILLTYKDSLDPEVANEIKNLNPTHIFIVGGTGVVANSVKTQLANLLKISPDNIDKAIERLGGLNRYETSLQVAEKLKEVDGTPDKIVVATGENFPDALSMSSIAAIKQMPILFTQKTTTDSNVSYFINSCKPSKTYVIGGNGVISDDIANSFPYPKRLSGQDRYGTNLAILKEFSDISLSNLYIATGENFPDALCGAARAAQDQAPMLLVPGVSSSFSSDVLAVLTYIHSNLKNINNVVALGGTAVLSDNIVNKVINPDRIVLGFTYGDTNTKNMMNSYTSTIDQIATVTFTSDSSGNISAPNGIPASTISLAHQYGIKPLARVANSNFSSSVAHSIIANPTNRGNFINNLLKALHDNNYGGVNIDFENVLSGDTSYFTQFMKEIYTALSPTYTVNVDVCGKTADYESGYPAHQAFDYKQIANYADQVIIMAYDYNPGTPGAIGPIDWIKKCMDYAVTEMPKEKIVLGLAAYGRDWYYSTTDSKYYETAIDTNKIQALETKYNVQATLDEGTQCEHFMYRDTSTGYIHYVWFEDAQSIASKLDIVNSQNLGGISVWTMEGVDNPYMDMIKAKFNK